MATQAQCDEWKRPAADLRLPAEQSRSDCTIAETARISASLCATRRAVLPPNGFLSLPPAEPVEAAAQFYGDHLSRQGRSQEGTQHAAEPLRSCPGSQ